MLDDDGLQMGRHDGIDILLMFWRHHSEQVECMGNMYIVTLSIFFSVMTGHMRILLTWLILVAVGIHALDDNTVLEVFEEVFPPSDQTTLKGTGSKVKAASPKS